MKHKLHLVAFVAILGVSACAHAQPSGDGPPKRKPPPEAFEACEGKSKSDPCKVSTPHGELNGTCQMPKGDKLVCAPKDKPPR